MKTFSARTKSFIWNSIGNSVSQDIKHKTVKHQKNNQLFIPAKQKQLNLNEFKGRKRYTNNLYWFALKPRATSNSQKPLGNPLSNQNRLHTNHQRSDLEPFKKHTSFGTTHTKNVDLDNLKSTRHSLATTPKFTKCSERITLVYRTIWNQYKCNPIPLSLEKTQSWMWMFKTWKQSFTTKKNSNLFFLFIIKHKQTIYSFQRLVKAFNRGAYSVENHLKHT